METKVEEGRNVQLKDIWDVKELRDKIDYFCQQVPVIQKHDILLFANYTKVYQETERDYARELLALNIIETLKQRGESVIKHHFNNHFKSLWQMIKTDS
jgi:hypothetical protein